MDAPDLDGNQTLALDGDGNTTLTVYDGGQEVEQLVYNAGHSFVSGETFAYDLDGNQTSSIDADGNTTVTVYDGGRETEQLLYNSGHSFVSGETFGYDADGNQTSAIDADGNTTVSVFSHGETTAQSLYNAGHSFVSGETFGYDAAGNQTSAIDADGNTTVTVYDGGQETEQLLYNSGHSFVSGETFAYDQDGHQTSAIDADGNTTASSYDGMGDVTKQIVYNSGGSPFGTTSWSYDGADNLTEHIDMDGITTYSAYNDNEMTLQTVYNSGSSLLSKQSWGYDPAGNVTMHLDINGYTTNSTYDDGQMTAQSVYLGTTAVDFESWGYDQDDNVTYMSDSNGNTTSSQFDGDGRVTEQVISNGGTQLATEEWTYDGNGNVTDEIDIITLGMSTQTRETRYSYDAMGHVTQEIDAYGTSLAATTMTDYDANGHLTEEIDTAGNTTLFEYDASGNETWTQNAMGYTSTMKYDANNHLTSEIDADGRLQTFTYDAQGLETGNSWFSGGTTSTTETESISFGYDANGNETLASNSDGTYTLSYNALGEVTRVVEPVGVTLSMGYDGSGNRTLLQDSLGGTTSSAYDTDNELTTEIYTQSGVTGALRMDQQYDWLGRVVEQERYSDSAGTTLVATTAYTYDAAGNITDLDEVNSASTLIANYTMGYDGIGELTQQTDHGNMTAYSYDQLGQLTNGGGTSQTYTASGNRTGDTTIAGNEVTYDGSYSYAYDHEGNETLMWGGGVTWAYSYDNDDHMTEAVETVSTTTAMEVDYKYDAFGNMTEETVISGATTTATQFVLDGFNPVKAGATGQSGWNKIADLNGSGSLITHYVWGDNVDQLFGRYDTTLASDPSGIYSTMTDPNGSVRDIINNNSGTYIASVQLDAFGNVLSISSPGALVADPADYLGHYTYDTYDYDAATGYYDVNARVYSSAGGRWLSQDPMGFDAGDSNLYRYVNNRPTEATDASGLQFTEPAGPLAEKGLMNLPFDGGSTSFGKQQLNDSILLFAITQKKAEPGDLVNALSLGPLGEGLQAAPNGKEIRVPIAPLARSLKFDQLTEKLNVGVKVLTGVAVRITATLNPGQNQADYYWWQEVNEDGNGWKDDGAKKYGTQGTGNNNSIWMYDSPGIAPFRAYEQNKIKAENGVIIASPFSKAFVDALIAEVSMSQAMKKAKVDETFKTHLVSTQGGVEKVKGTWNWSMKLEWQMNGMVPNATITLGPVTWKKGE